VRRAARRAPNGKLKLMSATGISLTLRQWLGVALGAIVPGLVLWFAMLYPLVPKGVAGLAIAAVLGVVVTVWAIVSVAALSWLNGRKKYRLASNALGLVVALQLGVGIFASARYHQDWLASHFSYFGR
jgi:hypothetical protein